MTNLELCFLPAADLAAGIRRGDFSAAEVTRAFLDRIERVDPRVNSYVTVLAEQALEQARQVDARRNDSPGPLAGVPFSVKDLVWTAGVRTTSGSRAFERFVPEQDARVVARLRAAGGVMLGKTNTPELGFKATTE